MTLTISYKLTACLAAIAYLTPYLNLRSVHNSQTKFIVVARTMFGDSLNPLRIHNLNKIKVAAMQNKFCPFA